MMSPRTPRRSSSPRRAKDEDYDEYMTGIPSAAPAMTGALDHSERVQESQQSAPDRELEAAFAAELEAPIAEAIEPAQEPVMESEFTANYLIEAHVEPLSPEAPRPVGRRVKRVSELALPAYRAGGRPAAEDLGGQAPVRQSIALPMAQIDRLQRAVRRLKRGARADLSVVVRSMIVQWRAAGAPPVASSVTQAQGAGRLVPQTLYLAEEQVTWLVGEVVARRGRNERADKSSLIRAAIEHGLAQAL